MDNAHRSLVLVDPDRDSGEALARRLRAQRFLVDCFADPAAAANSALASPPSAVIADLWMPGVSGVQLCRLLRSEAATSHVPIILRADGSAPRDRFWADRAGAAAYVPKGRIGELVRALNRSVDVMEKTDSFFTQLADVDVRDRIAELLDRALFESVIASEVRALGTSESFERFFDLFSQFLCQVTNYRWLALLAPNTRRLGLHAHPGTRAAAEVAARGAVDAADARLFLVEDADATLDPVDPAEYVTASVTFGSEQIAVLAYSPLKRDPESEVLLKLIAREVGGPLRMAYLVEEAQRLASVDPLTGIMNRRAFVDALQPSIGKSRELGAPYSVLLLDVDHFKSINDTHGHATGDLVLGELGAALRDHHGREGLLARWGGEEFVVALPNLGEGDARAAGEALRRRVEALEIVGPDGRGVPVTVSIGLATMRPGESFEGLIERADQAMYTAKVGGRNRLAAA